MGGNNRTTAIRIPTSTIDSQTRHIEHRIPGADSDPYLVISAILAGVHYGLKNKIGLVQKFMEMRMINNITCQNFLKP